MAVKKTATKKKKKQTITDVVAHIHSTYNNTIITITDVDGNVLLWKSAGTSGYKGTRKSTPYAAQKAAEACILELKDYGTKNMDINWNKSGPGKDSAIKAFQTSDIEVGRVRDVTRRTHSRSFKKIGKRH